MLMPFAMVCPPNMAALPHVAYPYPHYCNNPRPRFDETQADSSPRRTSSAFSANSTAVSSTPRHRTESKRPKTTHARGKKERTPISSYVIAALAGCSQYCVALPAPGPTMNLTPATSHTPSRAEQGQRLQAAADSPITRFTEHIAEPEKVRVKRRENVRRFGKKVGNWISRLCWRDNTKEEHSRSRIQPEEGARLAEKHTAANVARRKVSSASEMTLVEIVGHQGEELLVHTHSRVSPAGIYTGH
ncbi:hypothetical protein L211DRAFT_889737 [Terfezia boudieri ATCC MYA-4762]|uniref:Uncharacterized protein n=1 Tax=Terfezia boudieri ATCC MYA-4762 TaxID=1051890 RepID=A0A3N4LF62_9PEZI|nr:hypothetical protein L211DRAFT_889737 [Terfezia boudieri ATCC MYA-4762]